MLKNKEKNKMDNKEIFERNKEKVENAYEAFAIFYQGMDEYFRSKEVTPEEALVIKEIKDIAETLDKGKKDAKGNFRGYNSWTGDDLTRADGRLATLLLTLGEYASQAVLRANVMGRWTKWRKYNEWSPTKSKLEKVLMDASDDKKKVPRVFKEDIEAEVSKEIFAENVLEGMMAGHADLLTTMFDATKSLLTALAHRINLKKEERSLSRRQ